LAESIPGLHKRLQIRALHTDPELIGVFPSAAVEKYYLFLKGRPGGLRGARRGRDSGGGLTHLPQVLQPPRPRPLQPQAHHQGSVLNPPKWYTHKTSGFKTSGFKTSGFKTSGFKMSGFKTSGLQNVRFQNVWKTSSF
jgi:hypothetical protein